MYEAPCFKQTNGLEPADRAAAAEGPSHHKGAKRQSHGGGARLAPSRAQRDVNPFPLAREREKNFFLTPLFLLENPILGRTRPHRRRPSAHRFRSLLARHASKPSAYPRRPSRTDAARRAPHKRRGPASLESTAPATDYDGPKHRLSRPRLCRRLDLLHGARRQPVREVLERRQAPDGVRQGRLDVTRLVHVRADPKNQHPPRASNNSKKPNHGREKRVS